MRSGQKQRKTGCYWPFIYPKTRHTINAKKLKVFLEPEFLMGCLGRPFHEGNLDFQDTSWC